MNQPFDFTPQDGNRIVYVRPINVGDLPAELQAQVPGSTIVYSLNRPDGERLALVKDRDLAFSIALQNDLAPVSVH